MVRVGVFGATGEVGREIINVLHATKFPVDKLDLFAGSSAGADIETPYGQMRIQDSGSADYSSLDLAFWAVNKDWSAENWEKARGTACYVVDNSSAFRLSDGYPLIVPEINSSILENYPPGLIANPNCTTAIAAIPLDVINRTAGIEKIIFTTYQSVSGAGNGGIQELQEETRNYLEGKPVGNRKFQHPIPFNMIPHIDAFQENGYTREEMKTDWETKKILGLGYVKISSGCARVPVERSHAEDIIVETTLPVDFDEYRKTLENTPGIKVSDDPLNNVYPMPVNTSNHYPVEVGRIRGPVVFDNGIRMVVCGDQLLRGAALNAVNIGRKLYDFGKIR